MSTKKKTFSLFVSVSEITLGSRIQKEILLYHWMKFRKIIHRISSRILRRMEFVLKVPSETILVVWRRLPWSRSMKKIKLSLSVKESFAFHRIFLFSLSLKKSCARWLTTSKWNGFICTNSTLKTCSRQSSRQIQSTNWKECLSFSYRQLTKSATKRCNSTDHTKLSWSISKRSLYWQTGIMPKHISLMSGFFPFWTCSLSTLC
jgi:hypothetical protein